MAAITALVYSVGKSEYTAIVAQYQQRLDANAEERVRIMDWYIESLMMQVRFLSVVPPTEGIVRAYTYNGIDPLDSSSKEQWIKRLQAIFTGLISNHSELTQLRYIRADDNGKEIVRVDRVNGAAKLISEDQLQNKGDRDYVVETLKRPVGDVYVSHINLNQEHGKVAEPHIPTLRVSTPVASFGDVANGKHFGLIVINSDVSSLIASLNAYLPAGTELYLMNDKGEFIVHPQHEKALRFDLGHSFKWADEFQALPAEKGVYLHDNARWHVVSKPVQLNRAPHATPYTLALVVPETIIAAQVGKRKLETLLGSCVGVLASALLGWQMWRNLKLRQFSENMSALVEAAPYALLLVNDQGRIENVNAMTEEMFGYRRENLIGQPIEILVPAALREQHVQQRNHYLCEPSFLFMGQRTTLCGEDSTGNTFPVEVGLNYLKTDNGIKVLAGVVDIRQRKAAEAERDRLISILELTPDFIGLADLQGNLKFHNRAALDMVGLPLDSDVSKLHIKNMHPAWAATQVLEQGIPAVLEKGVWRADGALLHRDGREIPVSQVIMLHRNAAGEPEFLSTVMRDMSEHKLREQELIQARQDAESANRAKSNFVANMSHEIRTPLNAVIGMMQLLARTLLSSEQRDYVHKAELGAQSLLGVLNDILDFSKMEAGKITLDQHAFRLDSMLKKISVILFANVGAKDVEVLFDVDKDLPTLLIGDSMRLQQILLNLAGNAIKFTDAGEVILAVKVVARTEQQVTLRFEVSDTGIGIAPEHWEQIFEGFEQADTTINRRFGGTGLGLTISRRLVELMGGELSGHSHTGKGTTFHFELVFGVDPTRTDANRYLRLQGLRVLVVEDNPKTCVVLSRMLAAMGWHPQIAHDKSSALSLFENALKIGQPFDVAFINWNLPRMQGFKTGRQLRHYPAQAKALVIIMMTSHEGEHTTLLDKKEVAEVDALVNKPLTASALFESVLEVYRQRGWLEESVDTADAQTATLLSGVHILLVEDNAINQQVARDLLSREGAVVTVADNGQMALNMLAKNAEEFDVVLMDVQMPIMNGYDATEKIRGTLGLTQLPIIAMTANAMQEDRVTALARGMNDHVGKPFDIKQLCAVIRVYVPVSHDRPDSSTPGRLPSLTASVSGGTINTAIDYESALERFGDSLTIYCQSLGQLPAELHKFQTQLHQALNDENRENMLCTLHSIKGVSATLGASTFAHLIAEVEAAIKGGSEPAEWQRLLSPVPDAVQTLLTDIDTLSAFLDACLTHNENAVAKRHLRRDELKVLLQLLKNANLQALDRVEEWSAQLLLPGHFAALKQAVMDLNFKHAQALCEAMLDAWDEATP